MIDFIVLTGAHTTDPTEWECIRETSRRFAVPLHVLGVGQPYTGIDGYPVAIKVLRDSPARYAVLTDAYDVLVVRWNEAELAQRIENATGKLIVSCEANCWPDGPWKSAYEPRTPWSYANGGQYCGTTEAVAGLMQKLYDMRSEVTHGGGPQENLHRLYANGKPFSLDDHCEVFQSMTGEEVKYVRTVKIGRVRNIVTESNPMFLHFNGRSGGMREWYKALGNL